MNHDNQRVLIFCGPDMCGKTNISQELSRVLNIPYFKPPEERLTFLKNQDKFILDTRYADTRMADFLKMTGHSVIFDRSYPCEWVYSRFFNRESDEVALRYIDNVHSQIGTKIIIPYRSTYDLVIDDLDPSLTGSRLLRLEKLYREFSTWTKCECYFLNVDSNDLNMEILEIKRYLKIS